MSVASKRQWKKRRRWPLPSARLCLLLVAGLAEAAPKTSATHLSSNGRYSVRMTVLDAGKCQLQVLKGSEPAWVLDRCLGEAEDAYFVSDSGERVWQLVTIPEQARGTGRVRKDRFGGVAVAVKVDRAGTVLQKKTLGELMSPAARTRIRELGRHFKWLGGVANVAGKGPRGNAQNQVEFETVDEKTHRLDF